MPKQLGFFSLLVLVLLAVFVAIKIFPLEKDGSSFDAASYVSEQEDTLSELASRCSLEQEPSISTCVNWAEVSMAWGSVWNDKLPGLWEKDCADGQVLSCRRNEVYSQATRRSPRYWVSLGQSESPEESWPRVNDTGSVFGIQEWLSIGIEGLVHGQNSSLNLVCGSLGELPETLVCANKGNKEMNSALGRVISYVEQGQKLQTIGEHRKNPLLRFWQGVNLKRDDFIDVTQRLQSMGSILPEEERFWHWLSSRNWKYLLMFNYYSLFSGIPSHEFLHGLYFESEQYRNVLSHVFGSRDLPLMGLRFFIERLYNTADEFIKHNEMQAYLLQHSSFLQDQKSVFSRDQVLNEISRRAPEIKIDRFRQGL